MLELQHQPRPMPHAIPLQPVDSFLPWGSSHTHHQTANKLPPLRVSTSVASSPSPSEKFALQTATSALYTPPETTAASLPHLYSMPGRENSTAEVSGQFPPSTHYAHGHPTPYSTGVPNSYAKPSLNDSFTAPGIVIPASSESGKNSYSTATGRSQNEALTSPVEPIISRDMQVPASVRCPQLTLAQLAAEVTCLFWFENGNILKHIEGLPVPPSHPVNYIPDARPTLGFKKWVANLLATTQVKPNVVILALFFIYRLKGANVTVKGKPGSEYRLLTVALMLGNKFLDDNTYTNKTWADVSGISAPEVHIMEVEFLSNMRYSLFVSEAQWASWQVSLGTFGTYIAQCIDFWETVVLPVRLQIAPGMVVAPTLPSPPASSSASPQVQAVYSPGHVNRVTAPLVNAFVPSVVPAPVRPVVEPITANRKRSWDDAVSEPAAKRQAVAVPYQLPQLTHPTAFSTLPGPTYQALPRSNASFVSSSITAMSNVVSVSAPMSQLPAPAPRAMATVYPPHQHATTSQPITIPPIQTNIPLQTTTGAPLRLDPGRNLSPYPLADSANASPTANYPPSTMGTPQHTRLSPSYYLAQRSSPYKPVRRPHTLLAPPPTLALHNPARQISLEQMQYHSLGRPMSERQHGHLPYAGVHGQQGYGWSPLPSISSGGAHLRG